ncbi:MAG: DUF4911 domain-containing protein [Nitrospinae bacterium]|nr:DUF4911 domain-containing protein [Nitrospinota bacterium]
MDKRIVFDLPPAGSECHRIVVKVDPADIFYLTTLAETYEGLAIPRSVDQAQGIVEFLTAPDFLDDTRRMIEGLGKEIPIRILRA